MSKHYQTTLAQKNNVYLFHACVTYQHWNILIKLQGLYIVWPHFESSSIDGRNNGGKIGHCCVWMSCVFCFEFLFMRNSTCKYQGFGTPSRTQLYIFLWQRSLPKRRSNMFEIDAFFRSQHWNILNQRFWHSLTSCWIIFCQVAR